MVETLTNLIEILLDGTMVDLFLGIYAVSKTLDLPLKGRVRFAVKHRAFIPMIWLWGCKGLLAVLPFWVAFGITIAGLVLLFSYGQIKRLIKRIKESREQKQKEKYMKWLDEYFNNGVG